MFLVRLHSKMKNPPARPGLGAQDLAEAGPSWRRYVVVLAVYGLLFYGFFELGTSFSWVYEGSLWYPGAGLRWAMLLAFRGRFLPGMAAIEVLAIAFFGFLHPATHYYDSWWVLLVGLTPIFYGLATLAFVRWTELDVALHRLRDVVWFCIGAVLVPLAVVFVGRVVYAAFGLVSWEKLPLTTVSFWVGDTVGILMLTPLLLALLRRAGPFVLSAGAQIGDVAEPLPWGPTLTDLALVWASMYLLQHFPRWVSSPVNHVYWYLVFLPLIWISFHRGFAGSVIGAFAVTSGSAWLVRPPVSSFLLFDLQVLVISLALTTLLMGAAISSQRAAQQNLERHNRELSRLKAQLEARNKELESRRTEMAAFLRSLSHELKSPLVTIGGFVGHLEREMADVSAPKIRRHLERIRSGVRDLDQLLDGFVEFSGTTQTPARKASVDLVEVACRAVDELAPCITAGGVSVQIASDLPTVTGDRELLFQIFFQLIDNAVKFSGDRPDRWVEIGCRREDRDEVLYVRDNGRGIDRRYQEKVFEPFDQLDPRSEGTGIGLAVVKRIVEEHGGRIWIESKGPRQGAAICFTLA